MFENTVQQIINMKNAPKSDVDQSPDVAFAIYYGKFQGIAPKANPIISLVESRLQQNVEYDILLNELQKIYLSHRASVSGNCFIFFILKSLTLVLVLLQIMITEIELAINNLTSSHKGDHCALVRSACVFMVHVCQDEHRLFHQFFTKPNNQLT